MFIFLKERTVISIKGLYVYIYIYIFEVSYILSREREMDRREKYSGKRLVDWYLALKDEFWCVSFHLERGE